MFFYPEVHRAVFCIYAESVTGQNPAFNNQKRKGILNFMLDKFIRIRELYDAGRVQEARAVQHSANEVITAVCECGLLEATKYMLALQGIEAGHARKPCACLTEEKKRRLRAVAEKEGLLNALPMGRAL